MQLAVEKLLDQIGLRVASLKEEKSRLSKQLAPDFRIFDYLRSDEVGLSRCMAGLLDPAGTHGHGREFLDAFIENICPHASWAKNAKECYVGVEEQANGQRRIDIVLDFGSEGIIGIESKPWAADQDLQLEDYAKFLRTTAGPKNWLLIYLSNREPSIESLSTDRRRDMLGNGTLVERNFEEINDWLGLCAAKSQALAVRVFIEELIKFIRTEVNEELDMSEEVEIKNLVTQSEISLESAFKIYRSMNFVKEELLKKFHQDLSSKLSDHEMSMNWGLEGQRAWDGFDIWFDKQPQKISLRFEFGRSGLDGLFWGMARRLETYKDEIVWKEVNELMRSNFGSTKYSEWWPWYSDLPDGIFGKELKNWCGNEQPWIQINDGRFTQSIVGLALQVREIFKNQNKMSLLNGITE